MNRLTTRLKVKDRTADRGLMFTGIAIIGALFGFGATAQTMLVLGTPPLEIDGVQMHPLLEAVARVSLNFVIALLLAFCASWLRVHDRRWVVALPISLALAVFVSLVRAVLQMAFGTYPWGWSLDSPAVGGALIVLPVSLVIIAIGVVIVRLSRRARTADRARAAANARAASALDELQQEELRVRREVADTLHGTLQQHFLVLEAKIREVAEALDRGVDGNLSAVLSAQLREISCELDSMRERELRQLSAALYPEGLDRGLVPAARALVARIPRTIPVRFDVAEAPTPDSLERTARLVLVRVLEEGISNALRHGKATDLALQITYAGDEYTVEVRHSGHPPAEDRRLNGLARLQARLADYDGHLELLPLHDGGILRATIPAPRRTPPE